VYDVGLGASEVADVAGRLIAVADRDRSDGVNSGGTSNASRNGSIRSTGIPKKHAPSPASTAVSSISRDANPVSMSQYGAGHQASERSA
jgi:hypothetical protein